MSSTAGRVWATIKPHVPLIRFRKGGKQHSSTSAVQGSPILSTNPLKKSSISESITEAILPKRYMRKPMTDLEMQAIEMGGLKAL